MSGLTLDAGALVALERGDEQVRALLRRAGERSLNVSVPAGVVAQVWRGGARQAAVARLLALPSTEVVLLDEFGARAVGLVCGASGHADVVDVHVALVARERAAVVVTSDPDDLARVDPGLRLVVV
ncbi:PIN domain-containing protein [Gordonia sp. (in: high G+C Gram-positive bacteria)]|uniref:PIN domain-containing protein n=1 Tax=Gordonia sp. (in: high G+C Gram-positive bacteria) TaxID=84139 RepID=UPI0039E6D7A8